MRYWGAGHDQWDLTPEGRTRLTLGAGRPQFLNSSRRAHWCACPPSCVPPALPETNLGASVHITSRSPRTQADSPDHWSLQLEASQAQSVVMREAYIGPNAQRTSVAWC
jgi:hypothetical protein